jgi:SAM-dependent methyltransferase
LKNGLQEEILSDIEAIGKDEKLFLEKNFILRTQAMDDIEFHVIDRLHALMEGADSSDLMNDLMQHAEKVRCQLETVNTKMFQKLRTKISQGKYREDSLLQLIDEYLNQHADATLQQNDPGYDHLDIFLNGLLTYLDLPAETKDREPEMVYYQKTPVRIIFELVKKAAFQPGDVFYDLGSGLGQVTILVNLLTSVISKGVEYEPAYCNYARACAAGLNLDHVDFLNADARHADYSSGAVFFMYTPFEGEMLRDVLRNLHTEAVKRKVRIFSYGSCTREVEQQHWLRKVNDIQNYLVELAEFVSI